MRSRILLPFTVIGLATLAGCGGPSVEPVRGQVKIADGSSVAAVANGHVELESTANKQVRASGKINTEGQFEVQSQIDGKLLKGALPGSYRARVIPPQGGDDTDTPRPANAPRVARKFQDFETSGLTVEVPAKENVTLTIETVKR